MIKNTIPQDNYISINDYRALKKTTRETIRKAINDNKLNTRKIGWNRLIIYDAKAIEWQPKLKFSKKSRKGGIV